MHPVTQLFLDMADARLKESDARLQAANLREEYAGLIKANDPEKAARLLEVSMELGIGRDTIASDLAIAHKERESYLPSKPPVDTSKMSGAQLIDHAIAEQNARRVQPPQIVAPPFNQATATSSQLIGEGVAQAGPAKLPQHAYFK
jgi:hypothetical protein